MSEIERVTEAKNVVLPRKHRRRRMWTEPVICAECGGKASLVYGNRIYSGGEFDHKMFWLCPCGAYVGSHPNTSQPLGSPAGSELRKMRMECHAHFDALWRRKAELSGEKTGEIRKRAYAWLRSVVGCSKAEAHIGMFTPRECRFLLEGIAELREVARAAAEARRKALGTGE